MIDPMSNGKDGVHLGGRVKVAAVQVEARLADISWNIAHAESLAREAIEAGACIVALPEFLTTSIVYDERLSSCSLPPENAAGSSASLEGGAADDGKPLVVRAGLVVGSEDLAAGP